MVEKGIYAILAADADVSTAVGTRIYPMVARQGAALPYIVFQRISANHVDSTTGSSGLCEARIQVDCVTDGDLAGYLTARTLAEHVRDALQGYTGVAGTIDIDIIRLLDDRDGLQEEIEGSEKVRFVVSSDFAVWFAEAIPV